MIEYPHERCQDYSVNRLTVPLEGGAKCNATDPNSGFLSVRKALGSLGCEGGGALKSILRAAYTFQRSP